MSDREEVFGYEHKGKILTCTRRISGKVVLEQTITVPGLGSRGDRHRYGGRHLDPRMMDTNARQTAFEIIRDAPPRPRNEPTPAERTAAQTERAVARHARRDRKRR